MSAPNVEAWASVVLPALSVISAHDFVLVQDRDATVSGIVTAADMTLGFGWLAKPFLLLLGEVERRLRGLLSRGGRPEDLLADIVPASDSPP
jgi:hypothetical protein